MLQKTSEKKQYLIKISGSTTLLCTIVDVLRCLRPGSLSAGRRSARWSGVGTSTASPSSGPGLSPSSALVYKLFLLVILFLFQGILTIITNLTIRPAIQDIRTLCK